MAEAVVSFAVGRLGELLISEAKHLRGVSGQINEIRRELQRMQCFLEEADKKQNRDKRVRKWVEEMRELAFKIEDVIEISALKVMAKKQKSGLKEILLRFSCILNEGVNRHYIATEINAIKAELTNLTDSRQTYGITGLNEGESSRSLVDLKSRRTYSHNVEKDFVGMENEIEQLITRLKNEDNGCEVVSICGMGGSGKTTLAKTLYNHAEVKAHFQAFAWVCITQQFEREKVLKGVLKELLPADREGEVSIMDDAKLVKELYKVQQEKKCLIVIDDIWTADSWKSIKPAFPVRETTSGSKILLTTRNVTVAEIGSIYKIQGLSDDQGWQLLSEKAGILSDFPAKEKMEEIGRNMVKRCKGLPLAISTLGGLLKGKLLREWETINKDISFYLAKGESVANDDEYYSVEQVLGLSYDSLPPRLRHCFLCFANYEEDEIIETEKLYMYWIAEGLISVEDKAEGEMILDVAERYLDELVHRSLVQIVPSTREGGYWLKYENCRVHDLIRDLCLSKAKEENFINVIHLRHEPLHESKASIVRRLCIHLHDDGDVSKLRHYDQHVISHVRSLCIFNSTSEVWPDKIFGLKLFKLLRVLIASSYNFSKENMGSISKLVYLKYLCLRECELEELPTSIGNLRNLETLDLSESRCNRIPNVLWKLKHLKHLYLPPYLNSMVEKLKFEGLNDLELIYNYDSLYCDSNDLIQLCKLKVFSGQLRVEDNLTENIIDFIKHRELRHSHLDIEGDTEGEGRGLCLVLLLECGFIDAMYIHTRICKFPKEYYNTHLSGRLSELSLVNCRIEEDPMILLEKLPNLRNLSFFDNAYLGEGMVCSATGFPQLKNLWLSGLHGLKKWILDEGAMPNIWSIKITKCEKLGMLPEGLIHLTTLEYIEFGHMPTTFNDRIKVLDGVEGEDMYKVRHIPRIIFW